jgi:hypothetical protein
MADDERAEFTYEVSDEMLRRFAESTPLQRLTWLEEMRCFSWAAASEATRAEWRRLRARRRAQTG